MIQEVKYLKDNEEIRNIFSYKENIKTAPFFSLMWFSYQVSVFQRENGRIFFHSELNHKYVLSLITYAKLSYRYKANFPLSPPIFFTPFNFSLSLLK